MKSNKMLEILLTNWAKIRTEAIKNEMKGKPLTLKQKIHRIIGRSIALPIGHAIQKGWIKKVDINAHK